MQQFVPPLLLGTFLTILSLMWGLGIQSLRIGLGVLTLCGGYMLFNRNVHGHGILNKYFFKLPPSHCLVYGFSLTFQITLIIQGLKTNKFSPFDQILCVTLFLCFLVGLFDWYFLSFYRTYYFNEKKSRQLLKFMGAPPHQVERMIREAKEKGQFGPDK